MTQTKIIKVEGIVPDSKFGGTVSYSLAVPNSIYDISLVIYCNSNEEFKNKLMTEVEVYGRELVKYKIVSSQLPKFAFRKRFAKEVNVIITVKGIKYIPCKTFREAKLLQEQAVS